jgi:hypothetical protein
VETSPVHCDHKGDAALYVLGELRGYDLDAFARHLQTCDECAEEVELLEVASEAVPLLAARHVPLDQPEMRPERRTPLLAAAAAAAKAKAEAQEQAERERAEQEGGAEKPVLRAIVGGAASGAEAIAAKVGPASYQPGTRTRRRLLKQPVPKPAVIGLVLIAVIGAATIALSDRSASIRYLRCLPQSCVVKAGWTTGGGAAIKLEGNQAQLLVDGMPLAAAGTGYQVWVVNAFTKQLTPTKAWLRPNIKGEAGVNVPGDYHTLDAIAVYEEPLKGPQTTHSGAIVVADMRNQK